MLTLLISLDNQNENILEQHFDILNVALKYEKEVQVAFLAKNNNPQLLDFKRLVAENENYNLLIGEDDTSNDEMTIMGLSFAHETDAILCTLDTNPTVIEDMLEQRKKDNQIVYVRKKSNGFVQAFREIGIWAYNIGLKLLSKNRDYFAEVNVQYFDSRVIEALNNEIVANREIRITNTYKQVPSHIIDEPKIYLNERHSQTKESTTYGLGWVTFLYFLAFVALATVYPCLNGGIYSWWMILILVVWAVLGIFAIIYASKKIYRARVGSMPRVNTFGEPMFGLCEYFKFGDYVRNAMNINQIERAILKNKQISVNHSQKKDIVEEKSETIKQSPKKKIAKKEESHKKPTVKTTKKSDVAKKVKSEVKKETKPKTNKSEKATTSKESSKAITKTNKKTTQQQVAKKVTKPKTSEKKSTDTNKKIIK